MTVIGKPEFIKQIANASHLERVIVQKVFESTLEMIKTNLQNGQEIRLIGFGSFLVQDSSEREGRNPRTGETITIPASKRVSFRVGKELKDYVNGKVSKAQSQGEQKAPLKPSASKPKKK